MAPREEKTAFAIQLKRPRRLLDILDAKRRRVLPRKKGQAAGTAKCSYTFVSPDLRPGTHALVNKEFLPTLRCNCRRTASQPSETL